MKTEEFASLITPFAPEPSSSSKIDTNPLLRKSPRKRKAMKYEEDSDIESSSTMPLVPSPKKKKKQVKTTDSKARAAGSNLKKVKIYTDLKELDDHLQDGLDIIFCGINPGQKSSQLGHHFANPTNHFWSCLHLSGFTSRLLRPQIDSILPQEFSIGLTNLVSRATVKESELSKTEQITGVSELLQKIAQHQPRITCFVGLGIAEIVNSVLTGKRLKSKTKTAIGLQPYKVIYPDIGETLFYVVPSTSGRVVQYQKKDKIQQFTDLRILVDKMKTGGLDTEGLVNINIQSLGTPVTGSTVATVAS